MIAFSALGIGVSVAFKGGIQIGGASEGFEARGIVESDNFITSMHLVNGECTADLTLRGDGEPSTVYASSFEFTTEEKGGRNIRFTSPDNCYAGYVNGTVSSRRLASVASSSSPATGSARSSTEKRRLVVAETDMYGVYSTGREIFEYDIPTSTTAATAATDVTSRQLTAPYDTTLVTALNDEVTMQTKGGVVVVFDTYAVGNDGSDDGTCVCVSTCV